MTQPTKRQRRRVDNFDGIRARIQFLVEYVYGGNVRAFALKIGVNPSYFYDWLRAKRVPQVGTLTRMVKLGIVHAEWLLCGSGPIRPGEPGEVEAAAFADQINTAHDYFDTSELHYEQRRRARTAAVFEGAPDEAAWLHARVIHRARSHNMPVVLFLGQKAIAENAGPCVVEMMKKSYITGVALSSAAAMRDVERAMFGGLASHSDRLPALGDLNAAAMRAARLGAGYGEILGRWSFDKQSRRRTSVLAQAHELGIPATVHLALGDSMHHFFPAKHGAELGAALGAASYVDMLIFAAEMKELRGTPSGVFLSADRGEHSARLFANALAAHETDLESPGDDATQISMSGEYRHTFPALLTACDAVYDGSADDGRRMRRQ